VSEHLDDPTELATALGAPERYLVVLDFDGTLSPIVDRPGDAAPAAGALDAVRELAHRTSLAIISGREVDDLLSRLDGLAVTVVGGHGAMVRQPDGSIEHLVDIDAVTATLDAVEAQIRALVDAEPGWLVERKDASLAVHHRLAPEEQVEELLPRVAALLDARCEAPPGYTVVSGKAVIELRPLEIDKGRALRHIAERLPDLQPLVIGDDVTDEDAFVSAAELGGRAVLVAEDPRETAASHRLLDPNAVVAFLAAFARAED
jgi:trehalose 6-phosphate phosphatase